VSDAIISGAENFLLKKAKLMVTPTSQVRLAGNNDICDMPLTADLLWRCFMRSLMPWFERV
jgi:hypothetical protein